MKCQECGTPASGEDLFCGECGAILAAPQPEEETSSPIPEWEQESATPTPPPPASFDTSPAPDGRAKAALVLGIASIGLAVVAACLPVSGIFACAAPIPGIIAIVLGAIAMRDIKAHGGAHADWKRARLGLILGIVGTVFYLVVAVIVILAIMGVSMLDGLG
jgi:hypothetical protein